jgi:hypothetical protein
MSWKMSRLSTSLLGLLRESARGSESQAQVERIREEMLDSMAPYIVNADARPPVWTRVQYADDIQSLWFLRSDLMHMLSDYCGETLAATKVHELTALFSGHIPKAQFASAQRRR